MTRIRIPTARSRQTANHRARVGIERSGKTRARLIAGALEVFASHGADARIIDLVIRKAEVARGTFYNHFRTNEELFFEVAKEVCEEIIRIVDPLVRRHSDPAARIACGISTVVRLAIAYPLFARFVVRGGPSAMSAGGLVTEVVSRDVEAGIASGRFCIADKALAFDLVLGPVIMAFHAISTRDVAADYPEQLGQAVLLSLGVGKTQSRKYAAQDFGHVVIAEDSLFARASVRVPASRPIVRKAAAPRARLTA